ncbi:MAG: DNA-binding response regulator, partial [Acidobacteria bacterium]
RKVYDKLGVADRLELALYCLNNRIVFDAKQPVAAAQPTQASDQAKEEAAPTAETAETKKPS